MKLFFLIILLFSLVLAFTPCDTNLCADCLNSDNACRTCLSTFYSTATMKATLDGQCPCPTGYYLTTDAAKLCKYCNINCLTCTSYTYCTKCVEGYELLSDHSCALTNKLSLALLDLTTEDLNNIQINNYNMMDVTLSGNLKSYVSKCDALN